MEKSFGERSYENFARRYATIAETKPHNALYDRPAVLSMLPDVAEKRVLDIGCGPGFYAEKLLERGAQVVSFDVTPDFVEITRERIGDRATVLQHDLRQPLHFAQDGEFDGAIAPLVLDYIEDWESVFREVRRVLKPGGWLVCSAGHPMGDWHYTQKHGLARDYFATESFSIKWSGFGEPAPVVHSFRRPLAAQINPLLRAGLALEEVLEPLPVEAMRTIDPEHYEELRRQPAFLVMRARRPL